MYRLLHMIARNIRMTLDRSHSVYEPLVTVSIYGQKILNNLEEFERELHVLKPDARIAPVLKSNAYGHGLYDVAHILETAPRQKITIPFFIIDSYFEARTPRNRGITTPLLIIGYTPSMTMIENTLPDISFTITSLDELKTLQKTLSEKKKRWPMNVHLKIDTGMCRQGILVSELDQALGFFGGPITLEGITAHLADADGDDPSFTMNQIRVWNDIVKKVRTRFPNLTWWHTSATTGHRYIADIDANLTRLGLGLYLGKNNEQPALEMTTIITSIKKITEGARVGYNGTFTAPRDMTIAMIPVGYFEGVDRRLSNNGLTTISLPDGTVAEAPFIGRISMNISTIDVTHIMNSKSASSIHIGTKVTVINRDPQKPNSIEHIAETCSTIPYEILVHIPAHLKRVVHI